MAEIRMFLLPQCSFDEARWRSPQLFELLDVLKIKVVPVEWDGTPETLPTEGHVLVRLS